MFIKWFLKRERFIIKVIDWFVRTKDSATEAILNGCEESEENGKRKQEKLYQKYLLRCQKDIDSLTLPEDPDGQLYRYLCKKELGLDHSGSDWFISLMPYFFVLAVLALLIIVFIKVLRYDPEKMGVSLMLIALLLAGIIVFLLVKIGENARVKKLAATRALILALEERDHPDPKIKIRVLTDSADGRFLDAMRDSIGEVPRM